jgi:hypothetical protein
MLKRLVLAAVAAALVVLVLPAGASAWGGAHVGYTHVGPGGVYHTGATAYRGPYGGGGYHYGGGYGGYGGGGYRYGGGYHSGGYGGYGGGYHYGGYGGGYAAGGYHYGGAYGGDGYARYGYGYVR